VTVPPADADVVDLFAGPGGWDVAARRLGMDPVGVELDAAACATRAAAGLRTLRGDVAALDPRAFAAVRGVIASAPCPTFSAAGNGGGRLLSNVIVDCARGLVRGVDGRAAAIVAARGVLDPVYVADDARVAVERGRAQDPERALARAARDAAMSLLVVEPVRWVAALRPRWVALEHRRYVPPREGDEATGPLFVAEPERVVHREDHDLLPWVSMEDALGWGMTRRPTTTVTAQRNRSGGVDPLDGGSGARAALRRARETGAWVAERPATTVNGDPGISAPGRPDPGISGSQQAGALRVSLEEALVLQGFPQSYPLCGPVGKRYEQVGNAIPPPLADAALREVTPPGGASSA
jgi:DNA (cytosine-5)-methyltransferase 1